MTDRKLDQTISEWLEAEAPGQLPDRVLRATFERTRKARQQVGWRALLGRIDMNRFASALGGAAIVLVVSVVALGVYFNGPGVGVKPSPTLSASPTVTATTSAIPTSWSRVQLDPPLDGGEAPSVLVAGPERLVAVGAERSAYGLDGGPTTAWTTSD